MLADQPIPKVTVRVNLADTYKLLGTYYYRVGQHAEALPYYEKSYAVFQELAAAQPADLNTQFELTKATLAIGSSATRMGDRAGARRSSPRPGNGPSRSWLATRPAWPRRGTFADALNLIGETSGFAGDLRAARADMQAALTLWDDIVRADPRTAYHQRAMAERALRPWPVRRPRGEIGRCARQVHAGHQDPQ
jgi:tetratricopeptide (TPR) repeat protein